MTNYAIIYGKKVDPMLDSIRTFQPLWPSYLPVIPPSYKKVTAIAIAALAIYVAYKVIDKFIFPPKFELIGELGSSNSFPKYIFYPSDKSRDWKKPLHSALLKAGMDRKSAALVYQEPKGRYIIWKHVNSEETIFLVSLDIESLSGEIEELPVALRKGIVKEKPAMFLMEHSGGVRSSERVLEDNFQGITQPWVHLKPPSKDVDPSFDPLVEALRKSLQQENKSKG